LEEIKSFENMLNNSALKENKVKYLDISNSSDHKELGKE
jgi:hypothetical protein